MGMVVKVFDEESAEPTRIRAVITDLIRSTESHARSIAKAASWRMTGSFDTFIIAAFITGSPKAAGAVALTEILTKTALYYFHERIWILIPWGKTAGKKQKRRAFFSPITCMRRASLRVFARFGNRTRNISFGDVAAERHR
jgi:uncharacterized membrane protein